MGVDEDIRQIRNDIDRVRQDIDSINRVQVLASSGVIVQDIKKTVGKSKHMIAALFLTRDWLSSSELSDQLGINQANLDKVVNPLIEGGLLYREKRGVSVYYKRATRIDLIGFDRMTDFTDIYDSWKNSGRG